MHRLLEIKSFEFGPFGTNTYVVSDDTSLCLVDPACYAPYERQQLLDYISNFQFPISNIRIIATHGHLDHLWGAKWATEQWHTPVRMHEADIPMAKAMQQQYDLFGVRAEAEPFPIEPIHTSQISDFKLSIHPAIRPDRSVSIGRRTAYCFRAIPSFGWGTGARIYREETWDS